MKTSDHYIHICIFIYVCLHINVTSVQQWVRSWFFFPCKLSIISPHLSVILCLPASPSCQLSFSISSSCSLNHFSPRLYFNCFFPIPHEVLDVYSTHLLPASWGCRHAQILVWVAWALVRGSFIQDLVQFYMKRFFPNYFILFYFIQV